MKRWLDDKRLAMEECFLIGDSIGAGTAQIARSLNWKKSQAVAANEVKPRGHSKPFQKDGDVNGIRKYYQFLTWVVCSRLLAALYRASCIHDGPLKTANLIISGCLLILASRHSSRQCQQVRDGRDHQASHQDRQIHMLRNSAL
jgi:hypothetical protein